jgi:hypothetical protein
MRSLAVMITTEDEIFLRAIELGCSPKRSLRMHSWVCLCADSRHTITPERPVLHWSALKRLEFFTEDDGA